MRNVMGSEERAPAALGGTGPWALDAAPRALGEGAQVFAGAPVDQLGGAREGHRLASLFQGQRANAVALVLGFSRTADAPTASRGVRARERCRARRTLGKMAVARHGLVRRAGAGDAG